VRADRDDPLAFPSPGCRGLLLRLDRDQLYLLSRLHPKVEDEPSALLHHASRAWAMVKPAPRQGFMVIHKAKGLEFDSVSLPYCAGSLFKDDLPSRRRMYVAISRAQHRLNFLVSADDPTPLLRL
jgi:superfamily I DNA/RNA helicase